MTATDAALCAPVLEALFERAHGMLETPKDKGVLNRYSFGARCENARLFNLALGAHEYHLIHMTVDLAGGAVQSTMTLILPEPAEEEQPDEAGSGGYVPREARTLGETLLCVPAELSAVLCQVRMSLSQMNALKPGKTIPVPSEAFENVSLVSLDGRRVARGVMGQVDGQRALMLEQHVDRASANMPLDTGRGDTRGAPRAAPLDAGDFPEPVLEAAPVAASGDLPGLPEIDGLGVDAAADGIPDLPDLAEPLDLPDLGDPPNLPDLPDLPDLTDTNAGLSELGDLPKLNIA